MLNKNILTQEMEGVLYNTFPWLMPDLVRAIAKAIVDKFDIDVCRVGIMYPDRHLQGDEHKVLLQKRLRQAAANTLANESFTSWVGFERKEYLKDMERFPEKETLYELRFPVIRGLPSFNEKKG